MGTTPGMRPSRPCAAGCCLLTITRHRLMPACQGTARTNKQQWWVRRGQVAGWAEGRWPRNGRRRTQEDGLRNSMVLQLWFLHSS